MRGSADRQMAIRRDASASICRRAPNGRPCQATSRQRARVDDKSGRAPVCVRLCRLRIKSSQTLPHYLKHHCRILQGPIALLTAFTRWWLVGFPLCHLLSGCRRLRKGLCSARHSSQSRLDCSPPHRQLILSRIAGDCLSPHAHISRGGVPASPAKKRLKIPLAKSAPEKGRIVLYCLSSTGA